LTGSSTDRAPRPSISVVVLAFQRTHLLAGALRSVLDQGMSGAPFEVLVVANAVDEHVRAEFEARGVRFLRSSHPELGAKVAEGGRAATGEVICLLEDDDRFLASKLAEVGRRFRDDPELVYYHNNFRTIGPDGAPWSGYFSKDAADHRITRLGRAFRPARAGAGGWGTFTGMFPGFNNSCISLRRAPFASWWEFVARSDLTSDECLFLSAAATGGGILQDSEVLTELMIHPGSISNPTSGSGDIDMAALRSFSERNAKSRRVLLDLAQRSGRPDLIGMAEAEVAIQDLIGCLRDPTSDRGRFRTPLRIAMRRGDTLAVRNFRSVALLGATGVAAPPLARWLYRRFKHGGHG